MRRNNRGVIHFVLDSNYFDFKVTIDGDAVNKKDSLSQTPEHIHIYARKHTTAQMENLTSRSPSACVNPFVVYVGQTNKRHKITEKQWQW